MSTFSEDHVTAMRPGELCKTNYALANERGITDGSRGFVSGNIVAARARLWPGWEAGFELGIKYRKMKGTP